MVCRTCHIDKELNNVNFIPNKQMKNGFLSKCRDCNNIYRTTRKTKYTYTYRVRSKDEILSGKLLATSKKRARILLKMKIPKGIVLELKHKRRGRK